ncbi:hypothetical protein LSH36_290g04061 [Paralvinella palmiformis]|uniref:Uncharacterized protein n=1 Tax=Paralvinella palmiformis TaxID=53620 RepID=A0AAD9N332_9ANNE|nr:hypothetical protein LSH36_290g04061 [Paralvinella palmiformis]
MAAAAPPSETAPRQYMKYKRKFYRTDNYITGRSNVDNGRQIGKVSPVTKTANVIDPEPSRPVPDRSAKENRELGPINRDDRAWPPKKRRLVVTDFAEADGETTEECRPTTATFLQNLENQQTTQEICVALLSMAFWTPEDERHPADYSQRMTDVNGEQIEHPLPADEPPGRNNRGTVLVAKAVQSSVGNATNEVKRSALVQAQTGEYCRKINGHLAKSSSGRLLTEGIDQTRVECDVSRCDTGTTSQHSPVADSSSILIRSHSGDNQFSDGERLASMTDCKVFPDAYAHGSGDPGRRTTTKVTNCSSRDGDPVSIKESFVCSSNRYLQIATTETSARSTQCDGENEYHHPVADECPPEANNSFRHTVHPTSPMMRLSSGSSHSLGEIGSCGWHTDGGSPNQCSDSTHAKEFFSSPSERTARPHESLFPKPARGRQVREIVEMMARRHREDYFIGWTAEQILDLTPDQRPNIFPVTAKLKKDFLSKSAITENKKLAFSFYSREDWGHEFRAKLRNGSFKTLSDAKRRASTLWREHCPEYDETRAVRMRDSNGNIVMKRTRDKSASELEYRQRLRRAKVNTITDQIWSRRAIIAELLSSDSHLANVILEIKDERAEYTPPCDKIRQLADVIAHKLIKELLSVSTDRLL